MKMYGVRILVEDYDTMFRFYQEKLGLEALWGKPGDVYATFKAGEGADIALFRADLMAEALGNHARERTSNDCPDRQMIIIESEDVDRLYERLKSNGVEFLNAPFDMPGWGLRCVHLRDPEGNLIELFTSLPQDRWCEELLEKDAEYSANA